MPSFENILNIRKKAIIAHICTKVQNFDKNWNKNSTTVRLRFWELVGAPEKCCQESYNN